MRPVVQQILHTYVMDYGIREYGNGKSLENGIKVNLYMICKTNAGHFMPIHSTKKTARNNKIKKKTKIHAKNKAAHKNGRTSTFRSEDFTLYTTVLRAYIIYIHMMEVGKAIGAQIVQ